MSVFGDFLFVRLTVGCVIISLATALAAFTAVFLRLFTDLAIPGWATSVVGFAGIILLEALTLSLVATLMTLTNRSALAFIPALHALDFVRNIEKVKSDA
jgi:polyisoprenyl-phosphate glycosyltransferase